MALRPKARLIMPNPKLSRRIASRPLLAAIVTGLLAAAPVHGQTDRTVTKLAEGVYEIHHKDALDGNISI